MKKRKVALLVAIACAVLLLVCVMAKQSMKKESAQPLTYQFTEKEKLQNETYWFLTENGFSSIQASAIMAEIKVESDFYSNATAINDLGYGLLQWAGVRKDNLEKFADSQGKTIDDYETQLLFLLEEVNPESEYYAIFSYHGYEWTDFLQAENPREAAEAFCMIYVHPSKPSLENLEWRGDFAEEYWGIYNNVN